MSDVNSEDALMAMINSPEDEHAMPDHISVVVGALVSVKLTP